MGFKLKKIFRLKNLLKAAAIATALYGGYAAYGALAGTGAAGAGAAGAAGAKAAGAAAGAAGAGAGGATVGSALGSLGTGTLSLAKGIGAVTQPVSGLMTAASMLQSTPKPKVSAVQPETPFAPVRPGEMAAPGTLSDMTGMSDLQRRTSLATRGVQGGLGAEEEAYFNNLTQRTLLDEGNSVGGIDRLTPIELEYYRKKGLNAEDPYQLLRSLQRG